MSDTAEAMAAPSQENCFLCDKTVTMRFRDEFILTILQRHNQSSRLVFHPECFFNAAGDQYKKALRYDLMLPVPPPEPPKYSDDQVDANMLAELKKMKQMLAEEKARQLAQKLMDLGK